MATINIQAIEKITKLNKRITLISNNTKDELNKIYERIDKLETAVDELRTGQRSDFSRRRNRRHVVARGTGVGIGGRRRRRKKGTRRRGKKGGHAGNVSLPNNQPSYTELAAMINANSQRVYYLYVIDSRNDPPLEQAYGEHVHRFKLDSNGNKIAITGHRLNHHNQNPVYSIPNPAIATAPTATEITNNFYNPAQGLRRELRDGLTDMMGNLQM